MLQGLLPLVTFPSSNGNYQVFELHEFISLEVSWLGTENRDQEAIKSGNSIILGVFNTGATGIFIKRAAFKNIDHKIKKAKVQVKGRYALSRLKESASLTIKLPDFRNNKSIDIQAYIKDKTVGRHDIIKEIDFIQQLGLIFDFQRKAVIWDEITLPMRPLGTIKMNELVPIEAPSILQKAINCLNQSISSNAYVEHDYPSMVLSCTHLSTYQQDKILTIYFLNTLLYSMEQWEIFPNIKD
jgi:hypothetical protein